MLTESNELLVLPGVYDGFTARIALEVGFDGLYMVSRLALLAVDLCICMQACRVLTTLPCIDGRWNMCFKARPARFGLCLAQ